MELSSNEIQLLQLLDRPGFLVQNGLIVKVNDAATQFRIPEGSPIAELLQDKQNEYQAFKTGSLTLTIQIKKRSYSVSVLRMDRFDLFLIDPGEGLPELNGISLASQQLRTPLSNLMAMAENMGHNEVLMSDPLTAEQYRSINRNLLQLHRVLGNMTDAARYRYNRIPRMETCNVDQVICEIVEKISTALEQINIKVFYTGLNQPVYCSIDQELIERAVYNCCSNAAKAKCTQIHINLAHNANLLSLTIQDNGAGISDELKGQIFTQYMRNPSANEYGYGIGLGMVIIRAAAAAHDGTVMIDQPETGGLRVTITISIRQSTENTFRQTPPPFWVDYTGGLDHALTEFSDLLPNTAYGTIE